MKRKGIVFLSVAILISACTSYIDDNQNSIKPVVRVLGISATDSLLTPSDASVVALIERGGQILTKGVITEEVEEVIPIHDEEGNIIMYAVNYSNGGYVIVSATKDYYPVLARVEETYTFYGWSYDFFHMNWGWGGYQDGYFSESGWPSGRNYSTNREDLVNIYPKQN